MRSISLNGTDWTLTGYWQNQWRMPAPAGVALRPATPPVPAVVPGAVHADLLRAGFVPDWRVGLNAQGCEWVNNRDWRLERPVTVPDDFDGRLTLECDGLDHSGHVLIDGEPMGTFEGTHLRHRFDLTGRVQPGQTCQLAFIFDVAPQIDGVYGFTSRTRVFKPRFGYCWDWCTRLVNVGIWQDVRLVSRGLVALAHCRVLPQVNDDLASGHVRVVGSIDGDHPAVLRYTLRDEAGQVVATGQHPIGAGSFDLSIALDRVRLWWPATHGDQPLYHLALDLLDGNGHISDAIERTIGFKRVRWLKNPGAADGARPYLCEINGEPVFLRGVNWVPLSPLYGTVTAGWYETFLRLYRNVKANILRVWGGGILETPTFYDLCDRLGLLVWQEFPLSSSGIDNWPPEDPGVIEQLKRIAAEYIERRCHHASHLLWCGGNELQGAVDGGKVGIGRPIDESHPLMRAWAPLVEQLDPGKRFLPTSPTGPRFYAEPEHFGKGLHHQTHGPWANVPLDQRFSYFNGDDSLFRSELGAPGCSSLAALDRHRGDQSLWPPRDTNPYWLFPAAAWIPWDDVQREFGPIPDEPSQLPTIVKASRYLQAESYRYAAEATRRRHPQCSGFIIWMGHDCVFCTANNSVIQTDASTKPAYDWLQRAYASRHVSLKHDAISYAPGERVTGEVWVHEDFRPGDKPARAGARGSVTASLRLLDGRVMESCAASVQGDGQSLRVTEIDWPVPDCPERLFVIELIWEAGDEVVLTRYLLSQQAEHPLGPLLRLPPARLTATRDADGRITIRNDGLVAAIAVRVVPASPDVAVLTDAGSFILLPDESRSVRCQIVALNSESTPSAHAAAADLQVECFNNRTQTGVGRLVRGVREGG